MTEEKVFVEISYDKPVLEKTDFTELPLTEPMFDYPVREGEYNYYSCDFYVPLSSATKEIEGALNALRKEEGLEDWDLSSGDVDGWYNIYVEVKFSDNYPETNLYATANGTIGDEGQTYYFDLDMDAECALQENALNTLKNDMENLGGSGEFTFLEKLNKVVNENNEFKIPKNTEKVYRENVVASIGGKSATKSPEMKEKDIKTSIKAVKTREDR